MAFEDLLTVELSPHKFVNHIDKLVSLSEGKDVKPVTLELDLVSYCNHDCVWCVDPFHANASLERHFVSSLLKEAKSVGIEGIVFKGGGEPTLHESFTDILKEAKDAGFETGIVTNGSGLVNIYSEVVENASYLRVSIDGPTPELHKRIHRSSDFEKIINGVVKAAKLKKHLRQRHPVIGLSFAMDYSMACLIKEAIALGDDVGADYVLLRPPFFEEVGRPFSMTARQGELLRERFEEESRNYKGKMKVLIDYWVSDAEAKEVSSRGESPRRGRYMGTGSNGIEHVTGRCLASPLLAVIAADRTVYPCCNLRFMEEWAVGKMDYAKGHTFESVWKGSKRAEVMDRIHRAECIGSCTHPLSRYNEIIEYLKGPKHHKGFV